MNHEQIANNLSDGIDAALFEQYGAEWKRRAEQAERDRDTLAAEVRAWREWWDDEEGWLTTNLANIVNKRQATDAAEALTRAK